MSESVGKYMHIFKINRQHKILVTFRTLQGVFLK